MHSKKGSTISRKTRIHGAPQKPKTPPSSLILCTFRVKKREKKLRTGDPSICRRTFCNTYTLTLTYCANTYAFFNWTCGSAERRSAGCHLHPGSGSWFASIPVHQAYLPSGISDVVLDLSRKENPEVATASHCMGQICIQSVFMT